MSDARIRQHPRATAYPTLLSIQIRLAIDVPLAVVVAAATFAADFEGKLWDAREGLSSLDAFLLGAASFAVLFASTHAYVWWKMRRTANDPGVAELPVQSVVLSRRQTILQVLRGMPLLLVAAAIPILLAGPLGVGLMVGGTLGSAVSLFTWRAWERRTGLRAYTPLRPSTWPVGRMNPGPWLYYGPDVERWS
jgi:hypothetical protein